MVESFAAKIGGGEDTVFPIFAMPMPGWRNGRRTGLKILGPGRGVRVRIPLRARMYASYPEMKTAVYRIVSISAIEGRMV